MVQDANVSPRCPGANDDSGKNIFGSWAQKVIPATNAMNLYGSESGTPDWYPLKEQGLGSQEGSAVLEAGL